MANNPDTFLSALSDPTRGAVIARLTQGLAPVSELHAPHERALPSFLKHPTKLEKAKLIHTIKRDRTRIATIEPAPLRDAESWLSQQRQIRESRLDRLAALAERLEKEDP